MATRGAPVDLTVVESLPVLERSRKHLLETIDRGLSAAHVVAALEADPALVIACVRFARVPSISKAVETVPWQTLAAIATSLPVTGMFASGDHWGRRAATFRRHALAVRLVAERLARELPGGDIEQLTTAALLHDIGKLPLYGDPDAPEASPDLDPDARLLAERRVFGTDHAAVGAQLMREWELPESLVECVESHHIASEGPAGAIRMADMLAHYAHDRAIDLGVLIELAARLGLDRASIGALMYDFAHPLPAPRVVTRAAPLSARELEILRLLAAGLLAKQVALELGLADSTIRNHLHRIYQRIGAADRAQAVLIATGEGWL
jgi:putative nucleotidyltransferase with HDIG domain